MKEGIYADISTEKRPGSGIFEKTCVKSFSFSGRNLLYQKVLKSAHVTFQTSVPAVVNKIKLLFQQYEEVVQIYTIGMYLYPYFKHREIISTKGGCLLFFYVIFSFIVGMLKH